jgi:hypothetical protein
MRRRSVSAPLPFFFRASTAAARSLDHLPAEVKPLHERHLCLPRDGSQRRKIITLDQDQALIFQRHVLMEKGYFLGGGKQQV